MGHFYENAQNIQSFGEKMSSPWQLSSRKEQIAHFHRPVVV